MSKKTEEQNTNASETLKKIYGSEKEGAFANATISQINEDLELREKSTLVSNGIPYSQAYEYNQRKAINYAPPKNANDDREVSFGLPHEKVVGFISIFLKYVFKRRIKCYNENNELIKGMGEFYDLAIEHSFKLEKLVKKIALIYWELFAQGNAFVLEDWEVKLRNMPKAYNVAEKKGGKKVLVTPENMDYTYEFLDNLTYKKGEQKQFRRAISTVLDGRKVIFGNPEIEEVQDQPRITLEENVTRADAEAMFGSLKRWKDVPKSKQAITDIVGEALTIFDSSRHKKPEDQFIVHRVFDKENNRFNIYINGLMMLPKETPMTLFYPRGNYPLSNIASERLRGSIYARAIPAKIKFNSDFIDWSLKMMANKFEQGIDPAILSHGKYTLTRDMFKGGQVTHGVKREDFERADPENKGLTMSEFSFVKLLKEIVESQTLGATTAGELSSGNTAFEIAKVDQAQIDKLGFILDGITNGFMDMALRRAETIESKYTMKQKETIVDGKVVGVYQNFTVNTAGIENIVMFDEEVGSPDYDVEGKRDELFSKAFKERKAGTPTEIWLVNPDTIRKGKHNIDIEIEPEKRKESQMQMIQLWDEITQLLNTFGKSTEGGSVDMEELQKEYLEVSGRPDELFTSQIYQALDQQGAEETSYNMGNFGKPTIKNAQAQDMGTKR